MCIAAIDDKGHTFRVVAIMWTSVPAELYRQALENTSSGICSELMWAGISAAVCLGLDGPKVHWLLDCLEVVWISCCVHRLIEHIPPLWQHKQRQQVQHSNNKILLCKVHESMEPSNLTEACMISGLCISV